MSLADLTLNGHGVACTLPEFVGVVADLLQVIAGILYIRFTRKLVIEVYTYDP